MVTVDDCCNQVGCIGASNFHYKLSLVLITPPGYPYDTLYLKMIPDGDNIRYKQENLL